MFGLELFQSSVSFKAKEHPRFLSEPRRLLATARSAVRLLVRTLRPATVWLPSYICGVVIEAAQEPDVRVRFYTVGESLQIAEDGWLAEILAGDLVIFVDYFGFDTWKWHGTQAKLLGARIVEDACQAMLNTNFSPHSDYVILSPRKIVASRMVAFSSLEKMQHSPTRIYQARPRNGCSERPRQRSSDRNLIDMAVTRAGLKCFNGWKPMAPWNRAE